MEKEGGYYRLIYEDLLLNHTTSTSLLLFLINHYMTCWLWTRNSLIWYLWLWWILICIAICCRRTFLWRFCTILMSEKWRRLKKFNELKKNVKLDKIWKCPPQALSHHLRLLCRWPRDYHLHDLHLIASDHQLAWLVFLLELKIHWVISLTWKLIKLLSVTQDSCGL